MMSREKALPLIAVFFSFLLVAFGQPARSFILSVGASFFGYGLFWYSLCILKEKKQRAIAAFLWFLFVQGVQLSWMATTTYHGLYILIGYAFFLVWFSLEFSLLTYLIPYEGSFSLNRCLGLAGLWTLMEWSRLFFLCGFPFNPVGMALTSFLIFFQTASIFGVFGLSFLVMVFNFLVFKCFVFRSTKDVKLYITSICVLIFYGLAILGYHRFASKVLLKNCKVALIQTGWRPEEKQSFPGKEEQCLSPYDQWIEILIMLKDSKLKNSDLIVLPEASVSYGAYREVYLIKDVKSVLQQLWGPSYSDYLPKAELSKRFVSNAFWCKCLANYYQAQVIGGFDDYDVNKKKSFNAAFYFSPEEEKIERYKKMILVPIGEYLPFNFLSKIAQKYGVFDFFSPGTRRVVFGDKIKCLPSICFEECFGEFIRKGNKGKIDLLVNITNDGWFLPSSLAKQHFYHARLRSVENGVPLVRACNTGVTATIDGVGKIRKQLSCYENRGKLYKGVLVDEISLYSHFTLYSLWGDKGIVALSLFFLYFWIAQERFYLKKVAIRNPSS